MRTGTFIGIKNKYFYFLYKITLKSSSLSLSLSLSIYLHILFTFIQGVQDNFFKISVSIQCCFLWLGNKMDITKVFDFEQYLKILRETEARRDRRAK